MTIEPEISGPVKEQRLRQLKANYFDLMMNKVAYEAGNKTSQAAECQKLMDETETSYNAISAMVL